MKENKKKSKWLSCDVNWYVHDRKKPIAYSTKGCSNSIYVIWNQGYATMNKIKEAVDNGLFIIGNEELMVINEYISLGYGDMELNLLFL